MTQPIPAEALQQHIAVLGKNGSGKTYAADPDTGRMLHAVNQIAAGGRSRGIRLTMLTQRPQKLHKDTLTTADTLIAMRVLAPQDREAVKAWVDGCGDPAQGKEVLDSLAQLQRGEGWVWYPEGGVLHRVQFPAITTFDSSATPKDGDAIAAPRGAAEIDLAEIRAALADAAQEAADNDPKALRARIAELERKPAEWSRLAEREFDDMYRRGVAAGIEMLRNGQGAMPHHLAEALAHLKEAFALHNPKLAAETAPLPARASSTDPLPQPPSQPEPKRFAVSDASPASLSRDSARATAGRHNGSGSTLSKAERLILTALAQYPQGRTKNQVAILTGYAVNGGGFNNAVSSLRTKGFLEGDASRLVITHSGIAALGDFEPLPRGRALLNHWYGQLSKAERKALETLAEVYPRTLSKSQLANRAGYEANGGGFNNALSRLRTLELIAGRAELKASADLFG